MGSVLRTHPARGRRAGLATLAAAAVLISGCAAGQHAQTADEKPTLDGTEATIGTMDLRGLAIAAPPVHPYYPEGSDAVVTVVLVNNGTSVDRLIRVSSPAFTGWSAYDTAADAQKVVNADDPLAEQSSSSAAPSSSSSSNSSSGSSSGSSSSPSSATPTTPTASPTPTGSTSVAVPPGSRVSFNTPEATGGLLVLKFKRAVYPGNAVRITFTFADAGTKTVTVPIALTNGPNDSVIPSSTATGEG